jgi:NADPH:quinone reductase
LKCIKTAGRVLRLHDLQIGKPGPGHALLRLMAAGVNFVDVDRRRGTYPRKLPFVPGLEGAGAVEAVSDDVKNLKPTDRVTYTGQAGAYTEASLVQADSLMPLPEGFSFEQGAAFPLQDTTAHYLIHEFR